QAEDGIRDDLVTGVQTCALPISIAGVLVSAFWNRNATVRFGAVVRKYLRYRRALVRTCSKLPLARVTDPMIAVEGALLIATADRSEERRVGRGRGQRGRGQVCRE